MEEYTPEQKLEMYRGGQYIMRVPDVTTGQWREADWIKWIDGCKGWRPKRRAAPLIYRE